MAEPGLTVTVTVLTHRGAVRSGNEDSVVVGSAVFTSVSSAQPHELTLTLAEPVVIAVADGLGGHAAGEVASALAVQRLAVAGPGLHSKDEIAVTLRTISAEITDLGSADPDRKDMGTTVVGLVLTTAQTLWFNVGDSRAYSVSGGYVGQLSIDDTPTARFAEAGEPAVATGVVTQILGGTSVVPVPHTGIEPPTPEQVYLLCSDGLSDLVALEEIEHVLAGAADHGAAVRALWAAAMNAGGRDNITVVLVHR